MEEKGKKKGRNGKREVERKEGRKEGRGNGWKRKGRGRSEWKNGGVN